mmetsp:Transcript_15065/g.14636  ORF Transcript_15065/g.14636 Transcript_15065/m.14636 type:complete len:136 (+) Transcript_15065:1010-1417(+)
MLNKEKEFQPIEFAYTGNLQDQDQLGVYFEEYLFKKFNHPIYQEVSQGKEKKPTPDQEKFIAFKFSHHVEQQVQDEVNAPPIAKMNTSELGKEGLDDIEEIHEYRKKKNEIQEINPDTIEESKPNQKGELSQVPI